MVMKIYNEQNKRKSNFIYTITQCISYIKRKNYIIILQNYIILSYTIGQQLMLFT